MGYALDGFEIYGPVDDDSILDECNGRFYDGIYQYHLRTEAQVDDSEDYCRDDDDYSGATNWNYVLGCFHGSLEHTVVGDYTDYDLEDYMCDDTGDSASNVGFNEGDQGSSSMMGGMGEECPAVSGTGWAIIVAFVLISGCAVHSCRHRFQKKEGAPGVDSTPSPLPVASAHAIAEPEFSPRGTPKGSVVTKGMEVEMA